LETLSHLFWLFIKFNLLTTSGPASVGLLYKEAVGRIITESQFVQAVSFASILPGSDALQLAMFVGYAAGGALGALVALIGSILPPTVLMLGVEPITLEYPLAREVRNHWQNLLDTNTPQGHTLRQVLEESQPLGLPTAVKVRHGNVVPEILEEIREGNYDLICMGSAYSAYSLRHLYLPNVTAEVAKA
jgi:nucleotide-binding universal stress UspA family protein